MSETTAYRNHIKNPEIETREVFERETANPQNIQMALPMNIVTRLITINLLDQQIVQKMKNHTNQK